MKVAVIYGSNRTERQGIKAAKFILNKLDKRNYDTVFIDTMEFNLPLLDKMHKEFPKGKAPEMLETIHGMLESADGFVIVSGEYNHSIPPALKNLLDHFQREYQFKPGAIVSYSAGAFGGLRVAMHLRALLAELGMSSIPSIFPVPYVQDAFDNDGTALNERFNKGVVRFLDEFNWYLSALKAQRDEGVPN
ncbi:MAG: NAD(P)H-dependent oxidoreductase [Bacteroidales bacterium]